MTDRPKSARVRARRMALDPASSRASRSGKTASRASVKVDDESGHLVAPTPLGANAASPATQALCNRLERLAYPEQIEAIEADRCFHSAALCRRLQLMSLMKSPANPEVGSQLANLAVRISWHLEPGPGDRPGAEHDLRALAHGYLGAARRALGELEGAGDAFDMARTLRARGTGAPGVEAEIRWFEVWVRLDQHRFAAAIGLLDRMLAADAAASAAEPGSLRPAVVAPALAAKAWCCYHLGGAEAAELLLEEAQSLDLSDLPELDLACRFGRLWCAITLGKFPEAEARLADTAALVAHGQLENTAARWQLRRAQARIDVAMGRLRAAEQALREAAGALAEEKEGTEAALAWLALAKLRLEMGGSGARARVGRIAAKLVPAFLPEAARAQLLHLFLFTNACTRGKVSVAEVTAFARAIEGTRQPGLTWWSEWGTMLREEGGHDAPPLAAG
jgi:tetratricopeptide (TPR) repeat protein